MSTKPILQYTTQLSVDTTPSLIVPMANNEKLNMVCVQLLVPEYVSSP